LRISGPLLPGHVGAGPAPIPAGPTTGGGRARPGVRPGLPGRKHLHAAAGLTLPSPFVDRDVPDPAQDSLHPRKPREEPVSISPPPPRVDQPPYVPKDGGPPHPGYGRGNESRYDEDTPPTGVGT